MHIYFNRRMTARLIAFAAAVPLVFAGFIMRSYSETAYYRRALENTYSRALGELSGYLTSIASDMEKGRYVTSPQRQAQFAARVWRESGGAKQALSQLPVGELRLEGTYLFLSQAGEYAMALSRKASDGAQITDEERETAKLLGDYAVKLRDYVDEMQRTRVDVSVDIGDEGPRVKDLGNGLEDIEQTMQGYPTLIYDGPFSDHILRQTPLMTSGAPVVDARQAQIKAASAAAQHENELIRQDDENSALASYVFTANNKTVAVTKRGGYLSYLLDSRDIGEERMERQNVYARAAAFLKTAGLENMHPTYYEQSDGIFIINYAARQNDVVLYADLVKVGVALDDGAVVFYDARGYLMNHTERELAQPALSAAQARELVSDELRVDRVQLALIPDASGAREEVLTYEFTCTSVDTERRALVYINAVTGEEENVLLLINTPMGMLTR